MSDHNGAFLLREVYTSSSGLTRSVQVTPLETGLIPVIIVSELRDSREYFENSVLWNRELLFQNYFYVQDLNVIINIKDWLGDIQVNVFSSAGQADDNVTESYYGIKYQCNCADTWQVLKKELIYRPRTTTRTTIRTWAEACAVILKGRLDGNTVYTFDNNEIVLSSLDLSTFLLSDVKFTGVPNWFVCERKGRYVLFNYEKQDFYVFGTLQFYLEQLEFLKK
jgi:hypothetical protein